MYNKNAKKTLLTARNAEKLGYLVFVPALFAFMGYKIYQNNVLFS